MVEAAHKITVAYIGTAYAGWQRQLEGQTVQGELEKAVAKIWGQPIHVEGSGRTDTGVHARGQTAGFMAPRRYDGAAVQRAMNFHLPMDIRIVRVEFMEPTFHARFDVATKTYEYLLWQAPYLDPFMLDRAWHQPQELDLKAMRAAAKLLVGEHDFASFASNPGYPRTTTVRNLSQLDIVQQRERIVVRATSDGFLYHMVRNLTGALVKVGRGKLSVGEVGEILASRKRTQAPGGAPSFGLYLQRVRYQSKAERVKRHQGRGREKGRHLSEE